MSTSSSPAPAPSAAPYIEPWLSGSHADVPAAARAVLHALDLALDDLTKWTTGLTDAEIHSAPLGLNPIAFHLRHIARSTDRILTYAEGNQISAEQLAALKSESAGDEPLPHSSPNSKLPSRTPPNESRHSPLPTWTPRAALDASSFPPASAELSFM